MNGKLGRIEIITGCMFSGKTEELIRRTRRALLAGLNAQVFKPVVDTRHQTPTITSHDGSNYQAQVVNNASDILFEVYNETTVIAVDEIQFFDHDIVVVCETLADNGKRVICAGLDMDFRGQPFGSVPDLMAIAEQIDKLQAICVVCGEGASRTQRLVVGKSVNEDEPIVLIGSFETYEARCRLCHEII